MTVAINSMTIEMIGSEDALTCDDGQAARQAQWRTGLPRRGAARGQEPVSSTRLREDDVARDRGRGACGPVDGVVSVRYEGRSVPRIHEAGPRPQHFHRPAGGR